MMQKAQRKDPLFFLAALACAYAFFTFLHTVARIVLVEDNLCDFKLYYAAGRLLMRGQDIYQLDIGYHPLFFILFKPFAYFSRHTAALIWIFVILALIFLSIKLTRDLVVQSKREAYGMPVAFLIGYIVFSFQPLIEDMAVGQVNVILLFLFGVILLAYARSDWLCALSLSLMVVLKVQYGMLFLLFFWKRRYKVVGRALLLYLVWTGIAAMLGGEGVIVAYFKKLFIIAGPQNRYEIFSRGPFFFPCIFMALSRLFFNSGALSMETVKIAYAAVAVCVVAGAFLRYIPRGAVPEAAGVYELMFVTALMLLVTPFTEEHHLVILIPAFCVIFFDVFKQRDIWDMFLYGISFLLIALKYSLNRFLAFHSGFLSLFSMGRLFGIVMLCVLMIKIAVSYNKSPAKV